MWNITPRCRLIIGYAIDKSAAQQREQWNL